MFQVMVYIVFFSDQVPEQSSILIPDAKKHKAAGNCNKQKTG